MTNVKRSVKRGFHSGRISYERYVFVRTVYFLVDILLFLPILFISVLSRFLPRTFDIGLGPLPTINSRYHKQALERFGFKCETFVYHTWYFTDEFDVNIGRFCPRALGPYITYLFVLFRYKCVYTYFTGGPLGFTTLLAHCEPFLFKVAGIKTMIMPFGADVHVLTRTDNKIMVDAFAKDYPGFRHARRRTASLVDVWTRGADWIVSGCDWVDFMYYWDTLMLSHFAIDIESFTVDERPCPPPNTETPLRLIHAPNHRNLKGTEHIVRAVEALQLEGLKIELSLIEGVPNKEVLGMIRAADVVVDQLVLGWYAMFALEGMASGKPVVCHVRKDFVELYESAELLDSGELPLIDATPFTIKRVLRELALMPRDQLREIGIRSRNFVERRHSLDAVGRVFDEINQKLGIIPQTASLRKK